MNLPLSLLNELSIFEDPRVRLSLCVSKHLKWRSSGGSRVQLLTFFYRSTMDVLPPPFIIEFYKGLVEHIVSEREVPFNEMASE